MSKYASAKKIKQSIAEIFKPPRRVSVSEAASESLKITLPGGYYGPWDGNLTPYMKEPMDCLTSRDYEAVVFMGPARTGKTQGLVDGWMTYVTCYNPGDMTIYQPTKDAARDYEPV